jgi:DNA-binding HxlR family transcriptional regulator
MRKKQRSECPVNLTLEMLGDRWSLIVIRDVMFRNRRHYNDLLRLSEEGIASNILADRLNRLMRLGLLTRTADPTHKQKAIYSLTEASIQLVPLMACIIAWGKKHTAAAKVKRHGQRSIRGQILEEGGERMWEPFMAALRAAHLGAPAPRRSIFIERLAALERAAKPGNKTSK